MMKATTGSKPVVSSSRTSARRCHSSASPVRIESIGSTPASMPPAKLPFWNCGAIGRGDDDLGQRIRQRAFEAVADLDAHLALLGRDEEQRAVVLPLLAELPVPEQAVGVILDAVPSREGTVATTTWSVVLSSWAFSFASSAARSSGLRRFAASTTRPVRGGKVWARAGRRRRGGQERRASAAILPPPCGEGPGWGWFDWAYGETRARSAVAQLNRRSASTSTT